jgi:TonB-dependent receptor
MKRRPKRSPATSKALFTIVGGSVLINPVFAQERPSEELEEVIVTGIRGSLKASMDIKRDAIGVVDAISAEDIGKFPDTNLAESLQRISGVSIDRVNGEGSRITARGFGPDFNMVTWNGRAMPTADVVVVGSGGDGDFGTFTSRAFDMSNLASEGVTGIDVYKTSRAAVSSGGIGATINIKTMRPLESPSQASFGAKAVYDTSVERTGDEVTPEASALWSWRNDSDRFGISMFGSYQKRDSAQVGGSSQGWNVVPLSEFLDPGTGLVRDDNPATPENEATQFTNVPSGDPLVIFPNNSDLPFSETERTRVNGQLTLQFRPLDNLTLTLDGLYARNEQQEQRTSQGNWFNRPFGQVGFGNAQGGVVAVNFLQETLSAPKDIAWSQQWRETKDELQSVGFNAEWAVSDRFSLLFDVNTAEADSGPNAPGGMAAYDFGLGVAGIRAHSLDMRSGFPVQSFVYDDNDGVCNLTTRQGCRNDNGIMDIADVSSSVGRTILQRQKHSIDQFRLEGEFGLTDTMDIRGGVDHRTSSMSQRRVITAQVLGDWGVVNPGDLDINAPGVVESFCLSCMYDDFNGGMAQTAFRGNAATLYSLMSPYYLGLGRQIDTWNNDSNDVDEDITAAYVEFGWDGELAGRNANLTIGARYETTDVESTSLIAIPSAIGWTADNDFAVRFANPDRQPYSEEADYNHFLPSLDFSIEVVNDVVLRASASKTIARAEYGQLFVQTNAGSFNGSPTMLGGTASGSTGDPSLVPLESTNLDFSAEWYYGEASYVSAGYFHKKVDNFIGNAVVDRELFGLRDVGSGAPGTRSGEALELLAQIPGAVRNNVNLFVLTAMVDNPADFPDPVQAFLDNSTNGVLDQTFADQMFFDYDIEPNETDPVLSFGVDQPVNQEKATIKGVELAFQHFFGGSGFGIAGNYTNVDGDVGFDIAGAPDINQFALLGLSDTANATLIYENFGFSARLAYNWRGEFLAQTNVDGNRNPRFVDEFETWDLNVSYEVNDNLQLSLEGVNLTGENFRSRSRLPMAYWLVQDLQPRYLLGVRYKFN